MSYADHAQPLMPYSELTFYIVTLQPLDMLTMSSPFLFSVLALSSLASASIFLLQSLDASFPFLPLSLRLFQP